MRAIRLLLFLIVSTVGYAQNINRAEYFIDADPGHGRLHRIDRRALFPAPLGV